MKPTSKKVLGFAAALALLWSVPVWAASTPAKTLDKCQATAAKEAGKYMAQRIKTLDGCLKKLSKVIVGSDGAKSAADAAKTCISKLRKLENSEKPSKTLAAKMEAKIVKACYLKAVHSDDDVTGTGTPSVSEPLNVADIAVHCMYFGGDGKIDGAGSVYEWIDCLEQAATCQSNQQLALQYPRAVEWLEAVRPAMAALDDNSSCGSPNCGSCADAKIKDACEAVDDVLAALDADDDGAVDLGCGAGLPATGQTTSYGAGDDGDVVLGRPRRFSTVVSGTVTDHVTGLMWEKKEKFDDSSVFCSSEGTGSCGNPHDADNRYTWTTGTTAYDGTVVTIFLNQLNNRCNNNVSMSCTQESDCSSGPCGYKGFRDWRLPNRFELESLINLEGVDPATFTEFHTSCSPTCGVNDSCNCTVSSFYWSSTTYQYFPSIAWVVTFFDGGVDFVGKSTGGYVRAVRGGL